MPPKKTTPAPLSPAAESDSFNTENELSESFSNPTTISKPSPKEIVREKKRRRPALACEQCRRRKVRCDRLKPCGPCAKAKIRQCTYAPTHMPRNRKTHAAQQSQVDQRPKKLAPQTHLAIRGTASWHSGSSLHDDGGRSRPEGGTSYKDGSATSPSVRTSETRSITASSNSLEWLRGQVAILQQRLDKAEKNHEDNFGECKVSQGAHDRRFTQGFLHHQRKGAIAKVNYFGPGNWMSGAYLFPMELSLMLHAENTKDVLYWISLKSKDIARRIKANRFKGISSLTIGQTLPARAIADQLVDVYFRTWEGVYRILHRHSFRKQYEKMWQDGDSVSEAFVVQTQLCAALGSALYDETFTMRISAMRWVYEAQLWLAIPPEKDRMTYMGLQNMCLLTLARQACSVGPDLAWIGVGSLMRMAISMGLHRDPRQLGAMTIYRAELRRRLWSTVLELDLQCIVDAGGNPEHLTTTFDTLPPSNLNDEQLTDETDVEQPRESSNPLTDPSETSVQILLWQTHSLRTSILRHIERWDGEMSYDKTLSLNSELTKACRYLSRSLSDLQAASEKRAAGIGPASINSFHVSLAQLLVYRSFPMLHQPVIMRSLEDPRFYFSKKMYLDSTLKIAHICHMGPADEGRQPGDLKGAELDFDRFLHNCAGTVRNVMIQVLWGIGMRVIHLKEEQLQSMGQMPTGNVGPEMRGYFERTKQWAARRIRSGETGIKIYCFVSAAIGHAEKIDAGGDVQAIQEVILEHATEAAKEGLVMLKELAVAEGTVLPADDDTVNPSSDAPGDGVLANLPSSLGDYTFDHMGDRLVDSMEWMADWPWAGDLGDFSWAAPQPQPMYSVTMDEVMMPPS